MRHNVVSVISLVFIAAIVATIAGNWRNDAPYRSLTLLKNEIDIGDAPVRGSSDSSVVLVVFSDFQCPYCRSFAMGPMKDIATKYLDGRRLQIAFKHLPNRAAHPLAMRAASLASCSHGIEEGAFWRVHDVLFSAELSAGLMVRASAEAAKNRVSIDECVDQAETGRRIQADIDSARALGISSTPTVILGLRHERRVQASLAYSGVVPSSELSQQIDSLLKNSR